VDKDGEEIEQVMISKIEEVLEQDEAQAKITLLENAVHGFQESDTVTLSEVIGMEGLAGSEAGVNG
jgi:hypothetical protein